MADPHITIKPNGPYLVSGSVPLRSKQTVVSEHGESLTWRTGELADSKETYALCRCGSSANKPYCDGTHNQNDFDGSESAPTDSYDERQTAYPGTGINVADDRGICAHAAFCGNKVSNVWKMSAKTEDTVIRSQVMAMIERCPSGALTYEVDGEAIEPDLPIEISTTKDGPLWVTGGIPIERSDGESIESRNRVTLCRCGQSDNKPLCDGSHYEAGFEG